MAESTLSPELAAWADRQREERAAAAPARRRSRGRSSSGDLDRRVARALRGTHPRRLLLAELVAVLVVTAVGEVATTKAAPRPSRFIAAFVVYLVLAMAADFSPGASRMAAGLGGLVLLAVIVQHSAGILAGLAAIGVAPADRPTPQHEPVPPGTGRGNARPGGAGTLTGVR